EILPLSTFVIPAQEGVHSSTSAERTLFVGLIGSKTSIRFKMDPRVRKNDKPNEKGQKSKSGEK
ncbi:hypothetical protein M2H05_08735, partial [Vibrio vulnificus]|nr:hypothetical protein [Vibrio vulnificus]